MKFAPIVPIPMLESTRGNDYHMVLGGMLGDQDALVKHGTTDHAYLNFYLDVEGHKILDNGAAEGNMLAADTLLGWAYAVEADEVIAPDVMHDTNATIDLLGPFMRQARDAHIKVMAVLQGTTWVELDRMLKTALMANVAAVALPKLLASHLGPSARVAAAEMVREHTDIPIHALGCTKHPREVKDLARQGIVRGIDSAAPVVMGLLDSGLHEGYDWQSSHSAIPNYWEATSNKQVEVNLVQFRRWCEAEASTSGV